MEKTEVQIISDELGFAVAYMMIGLWGGRSLYIPDAPSPTHPIARDIGEDNLRGLCDIYGSQVIHLPKMCSAKSQRQPHSQADAAR